MMYLTIGKLQDQPKSEESGLVRKFVVIRKFAEALKPKYGDIFWKSLTGPMIFISAEHKQNPFQEAVNACNYEVCLIMQKLVE